MLSIRAVHFAVPPGSASVTHSLLDAREVDDAGDRRLLLVAARGGVTLLHLLGEVA
jgi:hypothetical protein